MNCLRATPTLLLFGLILFVAIISAVYWWYAKTVNLYGGDWLSQSNLFMTMLFGILLITSMTTIVYSIILNQSVNEINGLYTAFVQLIEEISDNYPNSVNLLHHFLPCDETALIVKIPDNVDPNLQIMFQSTFMQELFYSIQYMSFVERIPDLVWFACWANFMKTEFAQSYWNSLRPYFPYYTQYFIDRYFVYPPGNESNIKRGVHRWNDYMNGKYSTLCCCCFRRYRPERYVTCASLVKEKKEKRCETLCSPATCVSPVIIVLWTAVILVIIGSIYYWSNFAYFLWPNTDGTTGVDGFSKQNHLVTGASANGDVRASRLSLYISIMQMFLTFVVTVAVGLGLIQVVQFIETTVSQSVGLLPQRIRDNFPYSIRLYKGILPCDPIVQLLQEPFDIDTNKRRMFETCHLTSLFQSIENTLLVQPVVDIGYQRKFQSMFMWGKTNWAWACKRPLFALKTQTYVDKELYQPHLAKQWQEQEPDEL